VGETAAAGHADDDFNERIMHDRLFLLAAPVCIPHGLDSASWAAGGGGRAFGWGPQDDEASLATMRHAIEAGMNWIDPDSGSRCERNELMTWFE
jgi:hypothetical protein